MHRRPFTIMHSHVRLILHLHICLFIYSSASDSLLSSCHRAKKVTKSDPCARIRALHVRRPSLWSVCSTDCGRTECYQVSASFSPLFFVDCPAAHNNVIDSLFAFGRCQICSRPVSHPHFWDDSGHGLPERMGLLGPVTPPHSHWGSWTYFPVYSPCLCTSTHV